MSTLRRSAPLAALTALALGLASCGTPDEGPAPDSSSSAESSESSEPSVVIAAPDAFASDAPAWDTLADIPAGEATSTALSDDGTHFAYATTSGDGQTSVTQVSTRTGESTEEKTLPTLAPITDKPHVSLSFSAGTLIVTQVGEDPDSNARIWRATIFAAGSMGTPETRSETLPERAEVTLPSAESGPLVTVDTGSSGTAYAISASTAEVSEIPLDKTRSFSGCGDTSNCNLSITPEVQQGAVTVGSFQESRPGGRSVCSDRLSDASSDPNSGFDHCLQGFTASGWTSQDPDIAPPDAIPESGLLYASGDGYLVGAWRTNDGGTAYRTINLSKPHAAHAAVTCEAPRQGPALHPISRSPSGQFLAAGALLFDLNSGEGHCFSEGQSDQPVLTAVDDSGTAWGAQGSAWTPDRYTSAAVSAELDGTLASVEGSVAAPVAFLTVDGAQTGIFVVTDDATEGATTLGAYPLSQ